MKKQYFFKLVLFFILFIFPLSVKAQNIEYNCVKSPTFEKESFFEVITGKNYFKREIYESTIEQRLRQIFNAKVNAELESFNYAALNNGEFKSLELDIQNISYKLFHASRITAKTLCPYNKVEFKNKKLSYPQNLPFVYNAIITNDDIKSIIAADKFQKELVENKILISNLEIFKLLSPLVQIKDSKLYFELPVQILFLKKPVNFKFSADVEVQNDEILLKNIIFSKKSNIINNDLIIMLGNEVNPLKYNLKVLDSKNYQTKVLNAKIDGEQININGIFIINKI